MVMTPDPSPDTPLDIPDPDTVRDRLAVVMTEVALLRAQLRVSVRAKRERDRLRKQLELCLLKTNGSDCGKQHDNEQEA